MCLAEGFECFEIIDQLERDIGGGECGVYGEWRPWRGGAFAEGVCADGLEFLGEGFPVFSW